MSPLHLIAGLLILSFVDAAVPRTHFLVKGHMKESLRKLPWKWRHEETSYKVKTPLTIGVDVVSSYKVSADSVGIEGIFNTSHFQLSDCSAILKRNPGVRGKDGVYTIYPDGRTEKQVFCDMNTDGGGWTVIQQRKYGSIDFYRSWADYKKGFGKAMADYWLGNDAIHSLTAQKAQELWVDLKDFSNSKGYARYSKFAISSEKKRYRLTVSGYSGNADSNTGIPFSPAYGVYLTCSILSELIRYAKTCSTYDQFLKQDGACVDKMADCGKLGCEGYVWNTFTRHYCLHYCGVCPYLHLPNCVDMASNCSVAGKAYCTDPHLQEVMRLNCPAYCGFCSPHNNTQGPGSSILG